MDEDEQAEIREEIGLVSMAIIDAVDPDTVAALRKLAKHARKTYRLLCEHGVDKSVAAGIVNSVVIAVFLPDDD